MKSQILSIGDELLIGQVINTNAAFIAKKLNAVGIEVIRTLTVGDDEAEIQSAFASSFASFDVTIVTGGLGPTHDDITRKAVCDFFETDLILDASVLDHIRKLFEKRNFTWTAIAEDQALVPRTAQVIPNPLGTAPGMLFDRSGKYLIVLPGVPYEMERMMEDTVVPFFESKTGKAVIHRTIKTTGISESLLAQKLGDIPAMIGPAKLAFLPSPTGVRLRITHVTEERLGGGALVSRIETEIRAKAGMYIYGTDDEEIEAVVGGLLREHHQTLAVAESITGGLIANRVTNVAGSSDYFLYGVTSYSNNSKSTILDVPTELLKAHGAVSREVAEAMAHGVRLICGASIGLSTTGIAGPSGGSAEKPVGTVWIGYSTELETIALKFNFGEGRLRVKERAAQAALDLLRRKILKLE